MASELYQISSGMNLQMQLQEKSAMNLAGASLPGFKGEHMVSKSFSNVLAEMEGAEYTGAGVAEGTSFIDFGQGAMKATGRSLDFALNGEGFFQVKTADEQLMLTRNGTFQVNPDGYLITQEGHQVVGQGGKAVRFGSNDDLSTLAVDNTGNLQVSDSNGNEKVIGRLNVLSVENPQQMTRLSANYFLQSDEVQTATSDARLYNRSLEGANVSPIKEMSHMIESVRVFEMEQKIMQMQADLARQEQSKLSLS